MIIDIDATGLKIRVPLPTVTAMGNVVSAGRAGHSTAVPDSPRLEAGVAAQA
ncbi:MAG TPA: hypothetical protein VN750_27045 [Steroidobacteraceae bacterium]|nr:hypothetical protein [Steroidobacteraceae bacterium]